MSVANRMADRLQELLQQRALLKEHLAWLESEIAAASAGRIPAETRGTASPIAPAAVASPAPIPRAVSTPPFASTKRDREADLLLEKLAAEEKPTLPPSKAGCWLFFGGVLLILSLGTWALLRHFYA